jgi:hypothetical protein
MRMRMYMASKARRIWDYPTSVGRKPRRARSLANSLGSDRAGFEPRSGSGFAHECARQQTVGSGAIPTNIAHTQRLKSGAESTPRDSGNLGRAEIFALPVLDHLPYLT